MAEVKVVELLDGPGPQEKLVRLETADQVAEEVAVPTGMLVGGYLRASKIAASDDRVLIELPRESASGNWRVWVAKSSLK